jgi:hypothetical protein
MADDINPSGAFTVLSTNKQVLDILDLYIPESVLSIINERNRQISVEGWDQAHDDQHDDGQMMQAGMAYLWWGTSKARYLTETGVPAGWPWAAEWWKPKGRRRDLERAGALFLAEIARLERRKQPNRHVRHKLQIAIRELTALGSDALMTAEGERDELAMRYENWRPIAEKPNEALMASLIDFYCLGPDDDQNDRAYSKTCRWQDRPKDAVMWCLIVKPNWPKQEVLEAATASKLKADAEPNKESGNG